MGDWDNTRKVLEKYGDIIVQNYKANLKRDGRYATGALYDSVQKKVKYGDWFIELDLNLLSYWEQLEHGRGPTVNSGPGEVFPNIEKWITAKQILPTPDDNGNLPTPKQLAYLITRKIHEEGYEGKPTMKNTLDSITDQFEEELEEALEKDFDNLTDNIFKISYFL